MSFVQAAALRNERLETATLLPKAKRRCTVPGTSSVSGPILPSESSADVGRQLLSRPVCYADFGDLPDPRLFQLHDDLKGWLCSPSRLDFLHKELIRQRNAAVRLNGKRTCIPCVFFTPCVKGMSLEARKYSWKILKY